MTKKFGYSCGCEFEISNNSTNSIIFSPSIENINLECSRTWNLIAEGNTKGIFQLESRLGRSIAKKLKPENIEQLSALIAILRPGTLEAMRDGKSVTNHYIDKKNGNESLDFFHPSLEPILNTTYGEMIYQEQAMEIARNIAGFNLQEADMLRKAIGKKKPEEMAKIKKKFLSGTEQSKIVTTDQAEQIFSWIEKSQRYSFNKSHSVSYAMNAYLSAYAKAHFPKIFFASYLSFAKDKIDPQEEIKALVQNAREMDIDVVVPDFRLLNKHFVLKNNKIYFGLTDIKGVGESVYNKILKCVSDIQKGVDSLSWNEILMYVLININTTAAKALIESGCFSYYRDISRTKMLLDLSIINDLTKKELQFLRDNINKNHDLISLIKCLIDSNTVNKNRLLKIQNSLNILLKPPYSLTDNPIWIADTEDSLLGCSITCSRVDMYDMSITNCTCKELKNKQLQNNTLIIGGEIENINIVKTKNGKNAGTEMCFVTMSDYSGQIDSVIFFPEIYKQYRNILFLGNIIIVAGTRSKTKDGLIVEKAYIAKT